MLSLASWRLRAGLASGLLAVLACAPSASAQGGVGVGPGGGTPGGNVGGGGGNAPPTIASLDARQVPGQKFRVFGRVSDETPGNCGVVITGAINGVAMCDNNGNFDAVFPVPTLGEITAVPGDGVQSGPPKTKLLTNGAPGCSVVAVQGSNNTWTFSGMVADEAPNGLIVTLTGPPGVNGATATVQADGSWSVTLPLAPGTGGNVTATVTDWYGLSGSGFTTFG